MNIRIWLGIILLALMVSRASAGGARLAVPAPADEAAARKAVQYQYSEMYANPERPGQLALSKVLWQASTTADTANQEYALLCEARDAAARAGDIATAYRIGAMIASNFNMSLAAARVAVFAVGADAVDGEVEQDAYFNLLTSAIDQALLSDDFDPARKMLEIGNATIPKVQADRWQNALSVRQADMDAQVKAFTAIKPSIDRLRQNPSDPESSLIVGKYDCFVKGDWQKGLPLLDAGSEGDLQRAARMEIWSPLNFQLQGKNNGRIEMMIADCWMQLDSSMPEYAPKLHLHAYDWYLRGLPHVPFVGPADRAHIEEELAKLVPLVERRRPNAAIWVAIADALSRETTAPTPIIGGTAAVNRFHHVSENGGLLIGFHFSVAKLNAEQMITYLQPIYDTPDGEHDGPAYGRAYSKIQTVRAPMGYAIGAIKICGGAGINSITPAFMRIEGDRLNPAETLRPIRVGGNGGIAEILDGHGTPVIGICGKQNDGYLGLGLVYSQKTTKRP